MNDVLDEGSIFSRGQEQTLTSDAALAWADYLEAAAAGIGVGPEESSAWRESAQALRLLAERGGDITFRDDILPILDQYQETILNNSNEN